MPYTSHRRAPSSRRRGHRAVAVAGLAVVAVAGVAGCSGGASGQASAAGNGQSFVAGSAGTTIYPGSSGPAAPRVTGTSLTGASLSLAAYRGHVVVLNFWGSWCTPCRAEAPALAALARRFQPAGARFVGVDIRDDIAQAEAFDQNFGITYPSFSDPGGTIAVDFQGTVPPAGTPTTLVIGRSGRIAARVIGPVSFNGLAGFIARAAAAAT